MSEVQNQAHVKYFESSMRLAEMSDEHVTVLFSSSAGSLRRGLVRGFDVGARRRILAPSELGHVRLTRLHGDLVMRLVFSLRA